MFVWACRMCDVLVAQLLELVVYLLKFRARGKYVSLEGGSAPSRKAADIRYKCLGLKSRGEDGGMVMHWWWSEKEPDALDGSRKVFANHLEVFKASLVRMLKLEEVQRGRHSVGANV